MLLKSITYVCPCSVGKEILSSEIFVVSTVSPSAVFTVYAPRLSYSPVNVPPLLDVTVNLSAELSDHSMPITKFPLATSPCMFPSSHASEIAGRNWVYPSWLWSSASLMPAVRP